jgi:hypothetical protein
MIRLILFVALLFGTVWADVVPMGTSFNRPYNRSVETTIAFGDVPAAYDANGFVDLGDTAWYTSLQVVSTLDEPILIKMGDGGEFTVSPLEASVKDNIYHQGKIKIKRVSAAPTTGNIIITSY